MKITFKNVGLGDSIILESADKKVGIIDCKKFEKTNPTLDYIKTSKPTKILFIVLSHPHFDHYSGMLELLQYCETAQIKIEHFIHTLTIHPTYLNWSEIDDAQNILLENIIKKVIDLNKINQIEKIDPIIRDWQMKIDDDFTMHCLSPSDTECRTFTKQVNLFKENNEQKCSQAANLLSSIFAISNTEVSFLLTADAEKQTFKRLQQDINNLEPLYTKLVLGQIPHHGSINNHYPSFWKNLSHEKDCPAIISFGENKKYNFPHQEVVEDFKSMDYAIYATSHITDTVDFNNSKEDMELSLALDMDSEIIEAHPTEGDQRFLITMDNVVSVL